MAAYISLAAVQVILDSVVSDPIPGNEVKALSNTLLHLYFLVTDGWIITPERHGLDSVILRIRHYQRRYPDDLTPIHHTVALAGPTTGDNTKASLKQLEQALDLSNPDPDSGRCWALLFRGLELRFYEYHRSRPVGERLAPWALKSQSLGDSYHVRNDSVVVEEMLQHMTQHSMPDPG
ncbi:uncharacterized protein LDX57_003824 [Aspergillus melleus]|uniref:uncharacterized protein n=1 Tax=Aspergillus melleus TaxID=138277 RepID=UPI001E8CFCDA|nr:uncharacterized protein LDX57_003824 [Aspergillus melleus]KAH8426083.1 hypothetical protein LDX57_003824 [Aspergillus melleus]